MDCETRKTIMDAALRLFSEHGYDATPISRIAVEAGVGKSLIYHYFRKKSDMLDEIVDEFFRMLKNVRKEFIKLMEHEDARRDILMDEMVRTKLLRSEPYLKIIYTELGTNGRLRERFACFMKKWTEGIAEKHKLSDEAVRKRQFGFLIMFLTPLMSYYSMSDMYQDILGLDDKEIKEQFVDFISHMRKMRGR